MSMLNGLHILPLVYNFCNAMSISERYRDATVEIFDVELKSC